MTVNDLIEALEIYEGDMVVLPCKDTSHCGLDGEVTIESGYAEDDKCEPVDVVFISGISKSYFDD